MRERQGTGNEAHAVSPRERERQAAKLRRQALSIADSSAGMCVKRLSVQALDVVFVKGVIEASEGLAVVFAEKGGELTIAAPFGRAADLDVILRDLASEVGGTVDEPLRSES